MVKKFQPVIFQRKPLLRWLTSALVFAFFLPMKSTAHPTGDRPMDVVFCLDLSGSTNGLINDVRDNLWAIVNQANSMSPKPDLRIAVVGFSRPSFGKNTAYVKVLCDFTSNFDHLAADLYRLKPSIEKGDQFVDRALAACIADLSWSKNSTAYKAIFMSGNGMVTTAGYDYVKTCELAKSRGIIVNTLYVMKSANFFKELPAYKRIAEITGGEETEIVVNKVDDEPVLDGNYEVIVAQHKLLNKTYQWVGRDSVFCRKEQFTSDSGAFYAGKNAFLNRIFYKVSDEYTSVIQPCELVALSESEALPSVLDSATIYTDGFQEKVDEWADQRDEAKRSIRRQLPPQIFISFGELYRNNKLPFNSTFKRAVVNLLYKQW